MVKISAATVARLPEKETASKIPATVKKAVQKAAEGAVGAIQKRQPGLVRMSRTTELIHDKSQRTPGGATIRVGTAALSLLADHMRHRARRLIARAAAASVPRKGGEGEPVHLQIAAAAVNLAAGESVRAF